MAENNNTGEKKSRFDTYAWTSFWVVTGLATGILIVWLYGYNQKFSVGSALLWSLAYFFLGGLAGFIFGVPKIINSPNETQTFQTTELRKIIQENTNLTQISDWLTKVIIGVGLVEMKSIPPFILSVGKKMGDGIVGYGGFENVQIFCVGIILYFAVWGFICGYLVMRIVIAELLADQ